MFSSSYNILIAVGIVECRSAGEERKDDMGATATFAEIIFRESDSIIWGGSVNMT